jgi:hypothetical protein
MVGKTKLAEKSASKEAHVLENEWIAYNMYVYVTIIRTMYGGVWDWYGVVWATAE